jgi:uncharacterized repeat protein (TIGR02543 family)
LSTPEPTRADFTFKGWALTNNATAGITSFAITANTTLYAVWEAVVVPKFTVAYNANGGTGSVPTDATQYLANATVTVLSTPTPTRTNFTFKGWALTNNATAGIASFTITANTTLYAVWEAVTAPTTPQAITNLEGVANNTANTLALTWVNPNAAGVVGYYEISVNIPGKGWTNAFANPPFTVLTIPGTATSLNYTYAQLNAMGITADGNYDVRLKAFTPAGVQIGSYVMMGANSTNGRYKVNIIFPKAAAKAATNLEAVVTTTGLTLTWISQNAPGVIGYYEISVNLLGPGGTWSNEMIDPPFRVLTIDGSKTSVSYTFTQLKQMGIFLDGEYDFRLRTFTPGNPGATVGSYAVLGAQSAGGRYKANIIFPKVKPKAVTNLEGVADNIAGRLTLTWVNPNLPGDVTYYEIYLNIPGFTWSNEMANPPVPYLKVSGTATSVTYSYAQLANMGLPTNGLYDFRMKAFGSPELVSGYTVMGADSPGGRYKVNLQSVKVKNLEGSVANSILSFTWTNPNPPELVVAYYEISMNIPNSSWSNELANAPVKCLTIPGNLTAISYTFAELKNMGLTASGSYDFRIKAFTAGGELVSPYALMGNDGNGRYKLNIQLPPN